MMYRTLEQCINLFNTEYSFRYRAVRGMELISEWREAEKYWNIMGYTDEANACKMIADAIEMGDRFRAENKINLEIPF